MAENFDIDTNDEVENFAVDFGETTWITNKDFNKLDNRPLYDGKEMTSETDIPKVPSAVSQLNNDADYQTRTQVASAVGEETTARENADTALNNRLTTVENIAETALQPSSINKVVMTDIAVGANTSTTTFNLEATKENLLTGATSSKQVSMPVASSTKAGIMNSSTFDAVLNNANTINALLNGAVAITGLPAEPTQAQLTTAWETATGSTALMNRAGIYDVTNGKVWTYYTNDTTWHSVTNTTQVTINTFTNNSEGTIKGSTNVGQIFAEADGTGSVKGWDALNDAVANNTSDTSDLRTAVAGKQDKLTAGNGINIDNNNVISTDIPEGFFSLPATVEGEGSDITLNNTIEVKLDNVQIDGDTFQQTYSGKNLLKITTTTLNNVTTTLNADGSITCVGTTNTNYFSVINYQTAVNKVISAGTYTYSRTGNNTYRTTCQLWNQDKSDNVTVTIDANSNSATITLPFDVYFCNVAYNNLASGTAINFTTTLQLEAGSTATSFEKFVGGTASPNPDYPQDVQTVTGEQTVTVTGKNLWPFNSTYTNTNTTGPAWVLADSSIFLPAGTYIFSCTTNATGEYNKINFKYADNADHLIPFKDTVTLTFTDEVQKIALNLGAAMTVSDIQLEQGSTATTYELYQGQNFTINLDVGNMIDVDNFQIGGMNNGVPNLNNWQINCGNNPIKVSPNTQYTISVNLGETVKGMRVGIHSCDANLTFISDSGWKQLVPTAYTFITGANVEYVKLIFSLSTTSSTVTSGDTQDTTQYNSVIEWLRGATVKMNEGPSVIPDIELCKIGTYQDYIYKSGDDWYVHKATGKIVLDGTEDWERRYYDYDVYYRLLNVLPPQTVGYSNYFTVISKDISIVDAINSIRAASNNVDIIFTPSYQPSLEDFKTWLSAHNTTFYYVLATPTDTKITDNTLIGQLEALWNAMSHNGQTNIIVTASVSEDLPAILEVRAYQNSLNGLIGAIKRMGE